MIAPLNLFDRTPPHSEEAEKGVVCSILLKPDVLNDIASLQPSDFHLPSVRTLYAAMLTLHAAGKPIDLALIVDHLKTTGELDAIGGLPFLIDVVESVASHVNATYYADVIKQHAAIRAATEIAMDIIRDAQACDDAAGLIGRAEQKLRDVLDGASNDTATKLGTTVSERNVVLNDRLNGKKPPGVDTGLRELDRIIGLMSPGKLIVAGARPSMGKTALGVCVAHHVADRRGEAVLFFSMEMSRGELSDRFLSLRSGVNGENIRDARLSADDRRAIRDAQCALSELNIFIDDNGRRTASDIAAQTRKVQRQMKLGLVVIDYIGLIQSENKRDPRHEQVAAISSRLRLMAKELNVPVLLLCQLNRDVERGTDHKPKLMHLRESGTIEQDASVVLLLHRESFYKPDDPDLRGKAEIIVAKNRDGATGIANLEWHAETAQFKSAARGEEWNPDV